MYMDRIDMYLPRNQIRQLKMLEGSMSEHIRVAISNYLGEKHSPSKGKNETTSTKKSDELSRSS